MSPGVKMSIMDRHTKPEKKTQPQHALWPEPGKNNPDKEERGITLPSITVHDIAPIIKTVW